MAKNNTLDWVKYIEQAMKIYFNKKHRTIGMSPIEGTGRTMRMILEKYIWRNIKSQIRSKDILNLW